MKISLFFLIIIFAAIAGLLFSSNKSFKIDWNALTAVSTLLLAVITLITVWELRETRRASLKPDLIITDPIYRYSFRWIPKEDLSPIITPELKKDETNKYETRLPVLGLKNIGVGPALNIEVDWHINMEKNISGLASNKLFNEFNPRFKGEVFCLNQKTDTGSKNNCFRAVEQETTAMPYIVASASDETIQPLAMPSGISGAYDLSMITKARPSDMETIGGEPIRINIRYVDRDGQAYEKAFHISSELWYLPDIVSSDSNVVKREHFSDKNIRGSIRFHVVPVVKN